MRHFTIILTMFFLNTCLTKGGWYKKKKCWTEKKLFFQFLQSVLRSEITFFCFDDLNTVFKFIL